jgi:hypothetical protein
MTSRLVESAAGQAATETDILEALDYLTLSRDGVVRAVTGLSVGQWRFKPAPHRWSIHEVVEHLAVMEDLFHLKIAPQLQRGPGDARVGDPREMDKLVLAWEPDPSAKVVIPGRVSLGESPPQLAPTRLWDHNESLQRFLAIRERTAEFLQSRSADLRGHAVEHPALGLLDGYQWVLFIAAHSARHTKQILGVLADPKFPRPDVDSGRSGTTF